MIDQLIQQGITHFCIAPGSRSTPLVQAAAEHPQAKLHVHFDERGLGFFALGIAKASNRPAAIIVTSGTAVGNLLPSIMEAHHSCTPMIVLSADRPHELRDCGANQTTDQIKVFQPYIRWQIDLPCEMDETYFRSVMAQACFYAKQNPPGPVHINCPFREPLYQSGTCTPGKPIPIHYPEHVPNPYHCPHSKGVILVGKLPHSKEIHPILELAKRLNWPICADILSNARCFPTPQQIRYFDWIDKPTPDFILHFGERLTSKRILDWLKKINVEMLHVSPSPTLQDPARLLPSRVQSDIAPFCARFHAPSSENWLELWEDQKPQFEETGTFTEAHAMRKIAEILPPDYGLFLGNGMPIRDADHFLFPAQCQGFFGNRGLSGIDGNIGTIAGLAEEMPILGIIGDQTALHDLNSLALLKKTKHPVVLLISNNFGGGIFHHLPVSKSPYFEELWAAAHTLQFESAAKLFDLPYFAFDAMEEILKQRKTTLVELITSRSENYHYQKNLRSFAKS